MTNLNGTFRSEILIRFAINFPRKIDRRFFFFFFFFFSIYTSLQKSIFDRREWVALSRSARRNDDRQRFYRNRNRWWNRRHTIHRENSRAVRHILMKYLNSVIYRRVASRGELCSPIKHRQRAGCHVRSRAGIKYCRERGSTRRMIFYYQTYVIRLFEAGIGYRADVTRT